MKTSVFIFCMLIATLCGAQSKRSGGEILIQMKEQIRQIDSLCGKTAYLNLFPLFGKAKMCYFSSPDKNVWHKVKIRYIAGARYRMDVYKDETQKIKNFSINDKEASAKWKHRLSGLIWKMIRTSDSTIVWNKSAG